jgi:TonB family protein
MPNASLADQLDEAIERMIAERVFAPAKMEVECSELLGVAAALRLLPDPEFRAALKAELFAQGPPAAVAAHLDLIPPEMPHGMARRHANVDQVPTFLSAGDATYGIHRESFAISAVIHLALIALVATAGLLVPKSTLPARHTTSVVLAKLDGNRLPLAIDRSGGGGGGGDREKRSASKGALPQLALQQITPPTIVVSNQRPHLAAEPTVVAPPELSARPALKTGNPLSAILPQPSNGAGFGGGIGSGTGGGVGAGLGSGIGSGEGGGTGGGVFRVGGGVSAPRPIYDPDPQYSEAARQARFQGAVVLQIVVGADGRTRDVRVQRSVGMGLDQKAIEAVQQWRFEPAMKDGHPVATQVNVEVFFRLY